MGRTTYETYETGEGWAMQSFNLLGFCLCVVVFLKLNNGYNKDDGHSGHMQSPSPCPLLGNSREFVPWSTRDSWNLEPTNFSSLKGSTLRFNLKYRRQVLPLPECKEQRCLSCLVINATSAEQNWLFHPMHSNGGNLDWTQIFLFVPWYDLVRLNCIDQVWLSHEQKGFFA